MKKSIFLMVLLFSPFFIIAQFSSAGITGGYTTNGYAALAEYNHYTNDKAAINASVYFSAAEQDIDNIDVTYNNVTLNIGYFYTIIESRSNQFTTLIGGGVLAGYEILNSGDNELPNGALIDGSSQFIFGGFLGLNANYLINDTFAITANVTEFYHQNSDIGNLVFYGGLGIKFYIF